MSYFEDLQKFSLYEPNVFMIIPAHYFNTNFALGKFLHAWLLRWVLYCWDVCSEKHSIKQSCICLFYFEWKEEMVIVSVFLLQYLAVCHLFLKRLCQVSSTFLQKWAILEHQEDWRVINVKEGVTRGFSHQQDFYHVTTGCNDDLFLAILECQIFDEPQRKQPNTKVYTWMDLFIDHRFKVNYVGLDPQRSPSTCEC